MQRQMRCLLRQPLQCTWAPRSQWRSVSTARPPVVSIKNATFYRHHPSSIPEPQTTTAADETITQTPIANPPLFANLDLQVYAGEILQKSPRQHWAIIGTSGKTTFLEILQGRHHCIPPTARSFPLLSSDEISQKNYSHRVTSTAIQYVGFAGEGSAAAGGIRGAYMSARYESLREETDWTVLQYLKGETHLNPPEEQAGKDASDEALLQKVIQDLDLGKLLEMPVANLSNGQTRRAKIARALLGKPELLLLDEPFMGLDPKTVDRLSPLLHSISSSPQGPQLLLSLRSQDPVPDWITHVAVLGATCDLALHGPRGEVTKALANWAAKKRIEATKQLNAKYGQFPFDSQLTLLQDTKKASSKRKAAKAESKHSTQDDRGYKVPQLLNRELKKEYDEALSAYRSGEHDQSRFTNAFGADDGSTAPSEPLIEMNGVKVTYGEKVALGDWTAEINANGQRQQLQKDQSGLHWTVKPGERWGIFGANGSGKTTLLSLISSDHPQTYSQPIRLFGRSRLPEKGIPGISIFDIQAQIGHSSPEVHAFFPRRFSIRRTIESAWAETFSSKPRLNHERDVIVTRALKWFEEELNPGYTPPDERKLRRLSHPSRQKTAATPPSAAITETFFDDPDEGIEWADEHILCSLPFSAQRVALFLRAVVAAPPLVILDEAFSGMAPSVRDKCLLFLERGETVSFEGWEYVGEELALRKPVELETNAETLLWGMSVGKDGAVSGEGKQMYKTMREDVLIPGLKKEQALLVVSHVKEEVPRIVNRWLRLPGIEDEDRVVKFGAHPGYGSCFVEWDEVWRDEH